MPTYDYKCENCKSTFEFFQSMKDEPLTLCPECGHSTLKKMVSLPAGLIFKGTGFYLTDYAKKNSSSSSSTSSNTAKETSDVPVQKDNTTVKEKTNKKESKNKKDK